MKQLRILLLGLLSAALLPLVASPMVAHADVDIYTTPGYQVVNGREWFTACEAYSQTYRCRTEIKATQVSQVGGRFVSKTDWVFNNLTYAASPRPLWKGNPLAANGKVSGKVAWTATDGRKWRTECDTAATGRGGCRSYVESRVIEAHSSSAGGTAYRWTTKWVFNNMVRFGAKTSPVPTTTGRPKPTPAPVKPAPAKPVTPPTDVYYANCAAVRAAGQAPLLRGEPGYRSGLDRDNDGIACEP